MTDAAPTDWASVAMRARLRRRYAAERRFRRLGLFAVLAATGFVLLLLGTMLAQGVRGLSETQVALPVALPGSLGPTALDARLRAAAVQAFGADGRDLLADHAWAVAREAMRRDPTLAGRRAVLHLPAASAVDTAYKGDGSAPAEAAVARLSRTGALSLAFDLSFLTGSDATDPTGAGIWGALKGSLLTMLVTLALSFPIGVLAALYLEEYAPRSRWSDLIEVSINNLAAVPSIIFGLLGLAVFLATLGLSRSAPLVGGLTLALMTMPVIVIAARNAIKGVPPSVREAALAVGASPVQVVFDHVLPLALPGILTGTIIGMARALGETAPLLLIGMRAFIASPPARLTDPATVLPVQIFLWSDQVSRGFVEKTSAAILVLLGVLLAMNGAALYVRHRFETRW